MKQTIREQVEALLIKINRHINVLEVSIQNSKKIDDYETAMKSDIKLRTYNGFKHNLEEILK